MREIKPKYFKNRKVSVFNTYLIIILVRYFSYIPKKCILLKLFPLILIHYIFDTPYQLKIQLSFNSSSTCLTKQNIVCFLYNSVIPKSCNLHANAPIMFSCVVVLIVGYLINRMLPSSHDNKVPHSLLFSNEPFFKVHSRVSGSTCFAHDLTSSIVLISWNLCYQVCFSWLFSSSEWLPMLFPFNSSFLHISWFSPSLKILHSSSITGEFVSNVLPDPLSILFVPHFLASVHSFGSSSPWLPSIFLQQCHDTWNFHQTH